MKNSTIDDTGETSKLYFERMTNERETAVRKLQKVILENLPKGFVEVFNSEMLTFVVPHSIYPNGYHCDPKQPLPFISIASRKNYIALYHMGLYANAELLKWFTAEYPKHSKTKMDMGKSCIRFKKSEQIPLKLIGELCSKMTSKQWIEIYETNLKR